MYLLADTIVAARTSDIHNFYRPMFVVEHPTQEMLFDHTGRTELRMNEVLLAVHHGEDGPGFDVHVLREYSIAEQNRHSGMLQEWAWQELYADAWLSEPDLPPLTRDERESMAREAAEGMREVYEREGEEGDFADAERYLRDDACDEELRAEHAKWASK